MYKPKYNLFNVTVIFILLTVCVLWKTQSVLLGKATYYKGEIIFPQVLHTL